MLIAHFADKYIWLYKLPIDLAPQAPEFYLKACYVPAVHILTHEGF
jgi:hypothetical protein